MKISPVLTNIGTIKELPPKIQIVEDKLLEDQVWDFLLEKEIGEWTIKELIKEFDFTSGFARSIVEAYLNGAFLGDFDG